MAVAYPTTYDLLNNPTPSSFEDDVGLEHADQHANANDILELLETKLGKGASSPVTVGHGLWVTGAGGATGWGTIPTDAVGASQILDGSVGTPELGAEVVTPAKLAYSGLQVNQIINGGFEVWQRIANASSWAVTGGSSGADCWTILVGGTSLTCTRETTNIMPDGKYSLKGIGVGTNNYLIQNIENFESFRGKKITFSCWVKTSTAAAINLKVYDGVAAIATSSNHTGGGGWEQLSITITVSTTATILTCYLYFLIGATAYFDNAVLAFGTGLPVFQPLPIALDIDMCQRRFEIHYGGCPGALGTGYTIGEYASHSICYHTKKGGAPTLTKNGTWSVSNSNQPTVDFVGVDGYRFYATASVAAPFSATSSNASMNITSEWNL